MEIAMKKILIAATIALVAGAPLAFAAKSTLPSNAALTTEHCSYVEQTFAKDRANYKTEAAYQTAVEKALSLCRQDRHKNNEGVEHNATAPSGTPAARS
jgi:hypothetical protein